MARTQSFDSLYDILAHADKTYGHLPPSQKLELDKISQGLNEFGPRKLGRSGAGFEFREFRPAREGDTRSMIDERASASRDLNKPVVRVKEAEISQHVYLWRDASPSMDWRSDEKLPTKKQAAEVMLLAMAQHLARNEERVGILNEKGMIRGGKSAERIANKMNQSQPVNVLTGGLPMVEQRLPANSTAVLFSDFLMSKEELIEGLGRLSGSRLKGYLVVVMDPQELDFNFSGHVEFKGLESEGVHRFQKAQAMKEQYQAKMQAHLKDIEDLARAKGFQVILQRTDRPLHEGLMSIYNAPARGR